MNLMQKRIVKVLQKKMTNEDTWFFANLAAYKMAQVATNMGATVSYIGGSKIPVNVYALSLASSGFSKGRSLKYLETDLFGSFKNKYSKELLPNRRAAIMETIADEMSVITGKDVDLELKAIQKKVADLPKYVFTFGSGSTPEGLKGLMTALSITETGSVTLEIDEIGSAIAANKEVLETMLLCYTGDVEVLTEKGYQRLDELDPTLKVLQYDQDTEEVSFVHPLSHIEQDYKGDIYHFKSDNGFDFSVSADHECLVQKYNGEPVKKKPHEINTADKIITYGRAANKDQHISDELRLQIAFQADGSLHKKKKTVRFSFQKKRKQERLRGLLNRLCIPYSTYSLGTGQLQFELDVNYDMEPSKLLSDFIDITDMDRTSAREILLEISVWDGSTIDDRNYMYSSKIKENAETVQAICALAGYKAMHRVKVDDRSTKYSDIHAVYWNVKMDNIVSLATLDKKKDGSKPLRTVTRFDGKIYCVTVPTSNILIRRNGKQCIGGNCYDAGLMKNKLKKVDSNEEISNPVPTNLMAFGTPSKLLDGGVTEDLLMEFLETGFGRRFIYAYAEEDVKILSAEEKMMQLLDKKVDAEARKLNREIEKLADPALFKKDAALNDEANVLLFEYEEKCLRAAEKLKSYQEIEKTELSHRYFRALKLAGVFAFMEMSTEVTKKMIKDAIEVTEASGAAFKKMMTREKSFVRLARYIAEQDNQVTLAELTHDLSGFFKGSESAKREMMTLAKSWAVSNNIVIKENIVSDVSYYSGETMKDTDLEKLILSVSHDLAYGYKPKEVKWKSLPNAVKNDIEICTHHFTDGHRTSENALYPTNVLVLDVDDGVSLKMAHKLLEDYTYLTYTTKRHTEKQNRFRILMPMKHIIKLSPEEHKAFYENVFEWLPFEVDEQTGDISRKWSCYANTEVHTNDGELFDPTKFIPGTSKATETKKKIADYGDLNRLEAHIMANTEGRSNTLIKIALVYVDRGDHRDSIETALEKANQKFDEPLREREIYSTIMATVDKKIAERDS